MNPWMRGAGVALLDWRAPIAVLATALFFACAFALPNASFNMTLGPLLRADDRLVEAWRDPEKETALPGRFLGNAMLTLDWGRPIRAADVEFLHGLADDIGEAPNDDQWIWTKVVDRSSGVPLPKPFIDTVGDRTLGEAAKEHPLLDGTLISHDGHALALLLYDSDPERTMQRFGSRIPEHVEWRFISSARANEARRSYLVRDIVRTVSIEFVLFALILPLLFRSVRSIVIPLGVVLIGFVMSFGSLVLAGVEFTIIDCAVPGLIVVIGLSDAVHMMHRFEEGLVQGLGRRNAILEMLGHVGVACMLTSLTTAIGFLSLLVAEHEAVREFGLKSAYSVVVTLGVTLTLIPIAMSLWRVRRAAPPRLPWLSRIDYRFPKIVLAATAVVVSLAAVGTTRNYVDAMWLEELPPHDPLVHDLAWFDANFDGFSRSELAVRGDLDDPVTVRQIEAFQHRIVAAEPDVRACTSYVDYIREILGEHEAPLTDDQIATGAGLLALVDDSRFPAHLVDRDFDRARLVLTTSNLGMHRYFELGEIAQRVAAETAPMITPRLSGDIRVAHESVRLIAMTMLDSFVISLVAITVIMGLIYRSLRIALISIVPNALPVFIALGLTGWLDIPIRIGLVMLYSLGLGLAVDDTIHVLTRFRQERGRNLDKSAALIATLRSSGGALLITSLVLGVGAMCHLPSDMRSLQDVGVIIGAVVATALIADLFLLPLLLDWFGPGDEEPAGGTE